MEYDNINISNVEDIIEKTVKEKLEALMKIEHDQYLEENPEIKNGYYKRNLKTKHGELKELSVPRNRDNTFHLSLNSLNLVIASCLLLHLNILFASSIISKSFSFIFDFSPLI